MIGSSPRVWGNYLLHANATGVILVHPHVCGETHVRRRRVRHPLRFIPTCVGKLNRFHEIQDIHSGSSPRVWGNCLLRFGRNDHRRFIPTCVGKLQTPVNDTLTVTGSSPRVWGNCNPSASETLRGWFIPTCVGKLTGRGRITFPISVHPHVCGETGRNQVLRFTDIRFIPTCVGKLCISICIQRGRYGSSPRVWGN